MTFLRKISVKFEKSRKIKAKIDKVLILWLFFIKIIEFSSSFTLFLWFSWLGFFSWDEISTKKSFLTFDFLEFLIIFFAVRNCWNLAGGFFQPRLWYNINGLQFGIKILFSNSTTSWNMAVPPNPQRLRRNRVFRSIHWLNRRPPRDHLRLRDHQTRGALRLRPRWVQVVRRSNRALVHPPSPRSTKSSTEKHSKI